MSESRSSRSDARLKEFPASPGCRLKADDRRLKTEDGRLKVEARCAPHLSPVARKAISRSAQHTSPLRERSQSEACG